MASLVVEGTEEEGPLQVTPSRRRHPNECLNIFVDEFTRTLHKRSPGKAERVQVVTVVCRTKKVTILSLLKTMTKSHQLLEVKKSDTISYRTG